MTRTQIGSATTNSGGVAVFDYTPSTEGSFSIIASDGVLESNHVSLVVSGVSTLTLSSSKDVLSYYDAEFTTLTAEYTKNGSGINGKTVEFTSTSPFETITMNEIINNGSYTISSDKIYTINLVTSKIIFVKNESPYLVIENDGSSKFIGAGENIFLLSRDVIYVEYGVLKYYDSNNVLQSLTGYDLTNTVVATSENTSDDVISVYTVSDITDANGEASCTYNSQGAGDVTITAECMNLLQTYEVCDALKYVPEEIIPTASYSSYLSRTLSDFSFDGSADYEVEMDFKLSSGGGGFSIAPINNPTYTRHIAFGYNSNQIAVYWGKNGASGENSQRHNQSVTWNTFHHWKITKIGSNFNWDRDNGADTFSTTASWLGTYGQMGLYFYKWESPSMVVKNIKVKPL